MTRGKQDYDQRPQWRRTYDSLKWRVLNWWGVYV